jgi:predicted PurR-regulated permease PerM
VIHAVALVTLSLALAAATRPIADHWERVKVSRAVGLLGCYSMAASVALIMLFYYGAELGIDLPEVADRALTKYDRLRTHGSALALAVLPRSSSLLETIAATPPRELALGLASLTHGVIAGIAEVTVAVVLSFYWAARRDPIEAALETLWPSPKLPVVKRHWRALWHIAGAHLSLVLARVAVVSPVLTAAFKIAGLPFAASLALLAAIASCVPFFGAAIGVAIGAAAGAARGPVGALAGAAVVATSLYLFERLLGRRILPRRSPPLVLVLTLLYLTRTWGVIGILVAPPVAAMCAHLWRVLLRTRTTWHGASRGTSAPGATPAPDGGHARAS